MKQTLSREGHWLGGAMLPLIPTQFSLLTFLVSLILHNALFGGADGIDITKTGVKVQSDRIMD